MPDGWHHIAAVDSGTTTAFYVDGQYVGASDRKSTSDVYSIGNYQGNPQWFARKIDDVRIYDRLLSEAEIAELAGGGDENTPPVAEDQSVTTNEDTARANDGKADSNVATVSITVTPVNDAPVVRNGSAVVASGDSVTTGSCPPTDLRGTGATASS